jgi:hypothetical protein
MGEPYSRSEIEAIFAKNPYAKPERGEYCPRCGCHIPEYSDLSKAVESNLRERLAEGTSVSVISNEFQEITGCPLRWFKIWLIHPDGPQPLGWSRLSSKPCPYCGKLLRTVQAQQCFNCGADWHGKSVPSITPVDETS